MERLPVKLILTNEEVDRLLQILERSGDPDAKHLMDRLYQQQNPDTDSPALYPLPLAYKRLDEITVTIDK